MYQLDEVFNPWDLRQAVGEMSWAEYGNVYGAKNTHARDRWPGKNTERWVEFYTGDGAQDEFFLPQQIVVPGSDDDIINMFPDWDAYCSPREKVLVDGVLQEPGDDYEIYWTWSISESWDGPLEISDGDSFPLAYPRLVPGMQRVWWEDEFGAMWPISHDVDYANGKLYIWEDGELEEDETLHISYLLNFPASYIDFYEESVPDEDAHIKVLYSTFRIVYKADKFLAYVDGLTVENGFLEPPEDPGVFFLRYGPVIPDMFIDWTVFELTYPNGMVVLLNGVELNSTYWEYLDEYEMYYGLGVLWVDYSALELEPGDVIEVVYPILAGRWEWTTVGTDSAAVDSAGASMVTEGFRQWKNHDTKLASLDYQDMEFGPETPFVARKMSGTGEDREDYYDDQMAQTVEMEAGRVHFRDDWCTTLPVASSNIIVVGGPYVNLAAEYFNDFTDIYVPRIGTLGEGFYGPGCWNRNLYEAEFDENGTQTTGYALISTYKDINGTIGFIVYGWTGQDTYYAAYALQHGLYTILQQLQPGATSLLLCFDYTMHPADPCFFHVVECIGTFTECGGFDYLVWEEFGLGPEDGDVLFKFVTNSYSSEFWVFHAYVDFDVEHTWHLADVVAIEITYPQYIYFHWEAELHPDP
jgi:hypothetical protein